MMIREGMGTGDRKAERFEKLPIVGQAGKCEYAFAAQGPGDRRFYAPRQNDVCKAKCRSSLAQKAGCRIIDDYVEIAMQLQVLEAIIEYEYIN